MGLVHEFDGNLEGLAGGGGLDFSDEAGGDLGAWRIKVDLGLDEREQGEEEKNGGQDTVHENGLVRETFFAFIPNAKK